MSSHYELFNKRSRITKYLAKKHGFSYCGIAQARRLDEHEEALQKYLDNHLQGNMHYMQNHFEKRLDPAKLVPGTKTVISLLYNYYPEKYFEEDAPFKISRYALGKDYHFVLKDKLKMLTREMSEQLGEFSSRYFVDSAPILERAWARESGLGWIGKNTMLINMKHGSYFFLAEILLDMEMVYDKPMNHDFCGSCHKCIDACPTYALSPYKIDASRCISYFTIENKDDHIPEEQKHKYKQWIFGCDICQQVCPWNKFSLFHNEPEFKPNEEMLELTEEQWLKLTKDNYQKLFSKSAIKRAKYKGLKRNIHSLND
ncbi:MAG: tRNA epoxyqueuosine(34) reductase QueG [Bacteroidales bacterium]|nr:tRNA epoxyqueuosine(34) reductase QueG [Bacteroidales bacterium]